MTYLNTQTNNTVRRPIVAALDFKSEEITVDELKRRVNAELEYYRSCGHNEAQLQA